MKRIFYLIAAVVLLVGAVAASIAFGMGSQSNVSPGPEGLKLNSLWNDYRKASADDLPKKASSILEEIKSRALSERLDLDYYEACCSYVAVMGSRNWKIRDSLLTAMEKEIKDYGEPIVTFAWLQEYSRQSSDQKFLFVKNNARRLQGRNTTTMHRYLFMDDPLQEFIRDDYEYALWALLPQRRYSNYHPMNDEVYSALTEYLDGRYPLSQFLEYYNESGKYGADRKKAMRDLSAKFAGKAIGCYPSQAVLQIVADSLFDKNGKAEEFKALDQKCREFEKDRARFTGSEKKIASSCTGAASLSDRLNSRDLWVSIDRKNITVVFRNLPTADLVLFSTDENGKETKEIRKWTVKNPKCSFYVQDTVKVAMPDLEDGTYGARVVNGQVTSRCSYQQFTVSVAVRKHSDGWAAYPAVYDSGAPVEAGTISLWKGDKQIASKTMAFRGFTRLPDEFQTQVGSSKGTYYNLKMEYTDSKGLRRRSQGVSLWTGYDSSSDGVYSLSDYCNIYKDKGAYNPGDILKFKAILYRGNLVDQVKVLPEGDKVTVELYNSEGTKIESSSLKTNEFGSVSGEFQLPVGQRNGMFSLKVIRGSRTLATDSFRVDEFVLPTFDLTFVPDDRLYFTGDEIRVKGKVQSYSGHSLTGAKIAAKVSRWGTVVLEKEIVPNADGSFEVVFPAESSGNYHTEVKVTDGTGETLSFSTSRYVTSSLNLSVSLANPADGHFTAVGDSDYNYRYLSFRPSWNRGILDGNTASMVFTVSNSEGVTVPVDVKYTVRDHAGEAVVSGTAKSGDPVAVDLTGKPSGLYFIKAESSVKDSKGSVISDDEEYTLLKIDASEKSFPDKDVSRAFFAREKEVETGGSMTFGYAAGKKPLYVVATVFGKDRTVLDNKVLVFKAGTCGTVDFTYRESYPDAVRLQVFLFADGTSETFDREFHRKRRTLDLPLSFVSFTDKALPSTRYTVTMKADRDVEAVASVYDKSIDAIARNVWRGVSLRDFSVTYVNVSATCGTVGQRQDDFGQIRIRGASSRAGAKGALGAAVEYEVLDEAVAMEPMGAPMMMQKNTMSTDTASAKEESQEEEGPAADVDVREVFSTSLAFVPHIRSAADGTLSFDFETSDKLSTYYVKVFAHDKGMRNAQAVNEMVVSVPVKVAVVEPGYLYRGDTYYFAATVSGNTDGPVKGKFYLYTYPGSDHKHLEPVSVQRSAVSLAPHGTASVKFPVTAPSGVDTLGLKAVFVAEGGDTEFSDAVFVTVPVYGNEQTITETHSAVLLHGADREALLRDLRSRFVNVDPDQAELQEKSVKQMVEDAIPSKVEPDGKDVLSLSEAYYVGLLSGAVPGGDKEILDKILACRNSDGGFGWFEGMTSSQMITAVLLERFGKLRSRGFPVPELSSAVKFLDDKHFSTSYPYWCGSVSDEQYMYIRSLYPEVAFTVKPRLDKELSKRLSEFRSDAKSYLVPRKKDGRGLQGNILGKARRIKTLKNLLSADGGKALAKAWGIRLGTVSRMRRSVTADVNSLVEYAVRHVDGGWYYPNAVMPFRGLLESEAYAHSLICDLLSSEGHGDLADGIRLWLMLQKETQKWDEDPAFLDAVTSILEGSEELLDTKILIYKAEYTKPFASIKAAGNGYTVERKFYRVVTVERKYDDKTSDKNDKVSSLEEIKPGSPVRRGERIIANYNIWSQENRSFVRLLAPREASLRPVYQLSGHLGWWLSPLPVPGGYRISPQGYRNVKNDRTEYYFDSYPEEKTTVTEEFFVTQDGSFAAPVVTIESLYAPHYRANGGFSGVLDSRE